MEADWNLHQSERLIPDQMLSSRMLIGAAISSIQTDSYLNPWWAMGFGDGVKLDESVFPILRSAGMNSLRLSLNPRRLIILNHYGILQLDPRAVDYYHHLFAEATQHGIEIIVAIDHFDHYQYYTQGIGWEDPRSCDFFAAYSRLIFDEFRTDIKYWVPFNEPKVNAFLPYQVGSRKLMNPLHIFQAIDNQARAHIDFYNYAKLYDCESHPVHVMAIDNIAFIEPINSNPLNQFIASKIREFDLHGFLSKVHVHTDIIGLNYYWHRRIGVGKPESNRDEFFTTDTGAYMSPERIYDVLLNIHQHYPQPIIITELGIADRYDLYRSWYYETAAKHINRAVKAGVDVRGIQAWSIVDNYEMPPIGYDAAYGLFKIDQTGNYTPQDSTHDLARVFTHALINRET